MPTVADVLAVLDRAYPPHTAESWDAVGLVCGDPDRPVRRVHLVVDVVAATVAEAVAAGADLVVAHHPLLLQGVHGVPTTTYKGRLVHDLIKHDVALHVAHTNADVASPGVSDALAARLGLRDPRPRRPAPGTDGRPASPGTGLGRVGELPEALPLRDFVDHAAAALPATPGGLRAAGDPDRPVRVVAVCGGAGGDLADDAARAGADVLLTADLRHHRVSEHLEAGGPALVDAAHWATERPWLDQVAGLLATTLGPGTVTTYVSDVTTDPWVLHRPATAPAAAEPGGRRGEPSTP